MITVKNLQKNFGENNDIHVLKGIDEKCLACVRIKKDAFYLRRDCALKMVEKRLGYPVIIKPVTLGSSIGISFAENI